MPKLEQTTATRNAAVDVAVNLEKLTLPQVDRRAVQESLKAASSHMHAMLTGIANTFARMAAAATTKQAPETDQSNGSNGHQQPSSSLRAQFLKNLG